MTILKKAYLLLFLIALLLPASCSKVEIEGQPAPDFSAERFSSGILSLSEFKEKPIILYWFASW